MSDERTLSQLMLEGAALTLPIQGRYSQEGADNEVICACALGAAVVGKVGVHIGTIRYPMIEHVLGAELMQTPVKHPVTAKAMELADVIADLNDYHHWSRERTAEWLKELGL